MKEIRIEKGQEFKVQVRHIDENDIFLEEYKKAAYLLENILEGVSFREKAKQQNGNEYNTFESSEHNNNIIAFCGNRGEGKSSAMMSFAKTINELEPKGEKDKILFKENSIVRKTNFVDTIYIDPAALEGGHNILDIVLAKMFQTFKKRNYQDNKWGNSTRNDLLQCFQKVYSEVSLLKNSAAILQEEFDTEGSITKLARLSEGMNLKENMQKLFEAYCSYMTDDNRNACKDDSIVLLAIDDLDMNFKAAYSMAEQIRKYLILPNIIILMAVKVDQLQYCIETYNIRQLMRRKFHDVTSKRLDFAEMAEKYVSKLIPLAHRVYLPKVQDLKNVKIVGTTYKNGHISRSVAEEVLRLIYQKTGMIFTLDEPQHSIILPDNLRSMISLCILLNDMELPSCSEGSVEERDSRYYTNLQAFFNTYYKEWLNNLLVRGETEVELRNEIEYITGINSYMSIHRGGTLVLEEIYRLCNNIFRDNNNNREKGFIENITETNLGSNAMCCVMNMIRHIKFVNYREEYLIKAICFMYTVKLNIALMESKNVRAIEKPLDLFTQHMIWGNDISIFLPKMGVNMFDRTRFSISSRRVYNYIAHYLDVPSKYYISLSNMQQVYVKKFDEEDADKKQEFILSWILFGLICNLYSTRSVTPLGKHGIPVFMIYGQQYIGDNFSLNRYIMVSIENYLVRLSMLDSLYDQINFGLLGIKYEEFEEVINMIKRQNDKSIIMSQKIVTNVDIIQEMPMLCRGEYKQKAKDEKERSENLLHDGFEKMTEYLNKVCYLNEEGLDLNGTKGETPDSKKMKVEKFYAEDFEKLHCGNKAVDMLELYVELLLEAIEETGNMTEFDRLYADCMTEFANILELKSGKIPSKQIPYARYLTSKTTLETLKNNLLNMAKDIALYMSLSGNREYLPVEWKQKLSGLYSDVLRQLQVTPKGIISDSVVREKYKELTAQFVYKDIAAEIERLSKESN